MPALSAIPSLLVPAICRQRFHVVPPPWREEAERSALHASHLAEWTANAYRTGRALATLPPRISLPHESGRTQERHRVRLATHRLAVAMQSRGGQPLNALGPWWVTRGDLARKPPTFRSSGLNQQPSRRSHLRRRRRRWALWRYDPRSNALVAPGGRPPLTRERARNLRAIRSRRAAASPKIVRQQK